LQEPLRKIQTFVSMMDDEKVNLSNAGKVNLERIRHAATKMRKLIEDLSVDRQYEMTSLQPILEDIKTELKDTIKEKHAIIEAAGLLPVNIVAFQFRQLIYNLLSNALKFSVPDIVPHITIQTRIIKQDDFLTVPVALPQKCDYWNLTFTDNGIGFEPKFNERIFAMFQRLHTTEKFAGTGIGLAIVKKIVDNHNGIITAKSDLGQGAVFEIYIPIVQHTETDVSHVAPDKFVAQ
jgi:signal transduction histidine kinase